MKIIAVALCSLCLTLGASLSEAAPIQFVDTHTPISPVFFTDEDDSHSFVHDIRFDVDVNGSFQANGYDSVTDVLTSASLSMSFTNGFQGNDIVRIYFDTVQQGTTQLLSSNALKLSVNVSVLADGLLSVELVKNADAGDFTWTGSVLTVDGTRNTSTVSPLAVPEPATMLLMGAGLLGVITRYRARR